MRSAHVCRVYRNCVPYAKVLVSSALAVPTHRFKKYMSSNISHFNALLLIISGFRIILWFFESHSDY